MEIHEKLNKRPMGHIAPLIKQFNSINTYDYHNVNWEKKKPLLTFWELNSSSCEQTWIPFTQECFVPNLVENGPSVLKKRIFSFRQCIFAIDKLSPLGKGHGPSFEQIWIPFTQGCIVQSLVEIDSVVLEKNFF